MRWYDGANRIAHGLAKKYGVTPKQVAGVMAVLSPQKDWFLNLAQAEQVLETWTNYQNFKMEGTAFDDLLEATINKAEAPVNQKRGKSAAERKQLDKNARDKRRRLFAHLKGKTLKEIQEMGGKRGNILGAGQYALYRNICSVLEFLLLLLKATQLGFTATRMENPV